MVILTYFIWREGSIIGSNKDYQQFLKSEVSVNLLHQFPNLYRELDIEPSIIFAEIDIVDYQVLRV